MTCFSFLKQRNLWASKSPSKFLPAPCFGHFGMTRNQFDAIWSNIQFLYQLDAHPEKMPSQDCCWMLVQNFIDHFNQHCEQNFHPSAVLHINESKIRWHGIGDDWINEGLPMFVAVDRKPDYGCEIQSICFAKSGVMLFESCQNTQEPSQGRCFQY